MPAPARSERPRRGSIPPPGIAVEGHDRMAVDTQYIIVQEIFLTEGAFDV